VAEAEAEASTPQAPPRIPDFLANGEVAIVDEIYATETVDDICFADVRLWLPEANTDIEAKIVLDSLTAETAGLPRPKIETLAHRALFNAGAEQGSATAQREALKTCPYFNALQVKYAYAVTCHKAQGGQWTSAPPTSTAGSTPPSPVPPPPSTSSTPPASSANPIAVIIV
jgi:hypothetical protein